MLPQLPMRIVRACESASADERVFFWRREKILREIRFGSLRTEKKKLAAAVFSGARARLLSRTRDNK